MTELVRGITLCPICTNVSLYEYEYRRRSSYDDEEEEEEDLITVQIIRRCSYCGFQQLDPETISWDRVLDMFTGAGKLKGGKLKGGKLKGQTLKGGKL